MQFYRRFLSAWIALALLLCGAAALAQAEYDVNNPQALTAEHLFAESALLVDEDSGETLFSKNSHVRMFPASTTKIMTLLLALESDISLDSQVTIPAEAADVPEGSSVIPVQPGDVVAFSDLLYGFMLSSGNDGANAIAVLVDGSIDAFVAHMNQRAGEIGCEGTHYVNAHGYHDPQHYTTAQDLARISILAMKNGDFRRIVAAPKWTMHIQRGGKDVETEIISRNSLLQSEEKYYYPDCTGIKTGHHNKAGWCFVGSAQRDGKRVICVVLNCEQEMSKWYDAARLFEYGFTRYAPVTITELLERCREDYANADIDGAAEDDPQGGALDLNLEDVENGEQAIQVVEGSDRAMEAAVTRVAEGITIQWQRALSAPVAQGEHLGTLRLELEGLEPVTAALTASRAVMEQPAVTAAPTQAAVASPQPEMTAPKPARGGNPALSVILILAAVLLVSCVAVVVALKRAERRRRARARRRRQAQRLRPSTGSGRGERRR